MKVIIGPYKNWIGPYQIADLLCFWVKKVPDECGTYTKPEWVHRFGTWLAEKKDGSDTWLTKLCNFVDKRRTRQIYVRIDPWDTWSMDHTLAHIILPMLRQLKATKHGSPHVDDFDCPQQLWSTNAKPKEHDWDTDEFWHDRWEYVLNEMIWAFEQELDDKEHDFYYFSDDPKLGHKERLQTMQVDTEALRHYQHRKTKGLQLFGKYYQSLWD